MASLKCFCCFFDKRMHFTYWYTAKTDHYLIQWAWDFWVQEMEKSARNVTRRQWNSPISQFLVHPAALWNSSVRQSQIHRSWENSSTLIITMYEISFCGLNIILQSLGMTETNHKEPQSGTNCVIWGSHNDDYEAHHLPGWDTMWSGRHVPIFQWNLLPPSSGFWRWTKNPLPKHYTYQSTSHLIQKKTVIFRSLLIKSEVRCQTWPVAWDITFHATLPVLSNLPVALAKTVLQLHKT